MRAVNLAIDKIVALTTKMPERNLRGIAHGAEHGLTKKYLANGYAIHAANQFPPMPAFQTMGVSQLVQASIGRMHGSADPGAILTGPWQRAGPHDLLKGSVVADDEFISP